MPTQLSTERHLEGLREAALAFATYADRAGLEAPVPSCPEWTVRDLVAHQAMVHAWAAAILRGERPRPEDTGTHRDSVASLDDPLAALGAGVTALVAAVEQAPASLAGLVFLEDAPSAVSAFWARRQCHETTMHAVDALSASLGRLPRPDEVWVDPELAGDGVDELLGGFVTRPRSRLRCDDDALLVVRPDDLEDWWQVAIGPRPAVTTRHRGGEPPEADWELTGPAVELYLRLWNRMEAPAGWRHLAAVTWG